MTASTHREAWGITDTPAAASTTPPKPKPKPKPAPAAPTAGKPEYVRVTLNIPADLYRQLRKWTGTAADEIGAHQVSQQDALRAMITAVVADKSIGLVVIDLLRRGNR
jgi:hypothetical protein